MLNNIIKIGIDSFSKNINDLYLNNELNQGLYKNNFIYHLEELLKYYFIATKGENEIVLNKKTYLSLEQFVLESNISGYDSDEPEIDWNFIYDAKDILNKKIKEQLAKEQNSETLKPFITSVLDAFESSLIYSYSFKTENNPWYPALNILSKNGCIYLVSDNEAEINNYVPKTSKKITGKNIGIIAASKKHVKKGNSFSGFALEHNYSLDAALYNYLLTNAQGKQSAKSSSKIKEFFNSNGRYVDENILKGSTLSLKRQGLIGSTSNGFYSINKYEDAFDAFIFHKEKVDGILKTMQSYANRLEFAGDTRLKNKLCEYFNSLHC